jgi:hypothetical protein
LNNIKRFSPFHSYNSPLFGQHQVPIAAALTSAISKDSFHEVLASATVSILWAQEWWIVYTVVAIIVLIGTQVPSSTTTHKMEEVLFYLDVVLQIDVVDSQGFKKDHVALGNSCQLCYRLTSTRSGQFQVLVVCCSM